MMTETEYIKASNLANITCAIAVMRNVLASNADEYGINKQELIEITSRLSAAQSKLFKLTETEGE